MARVKPAYRSVGLQERKVGGKKKKTKAKFAILSRNAGCELLGVDVAEEVRTSLWMLKTCAAALKEALCLKKG